MTLSRGLPIQNSDDATIVAQVMAGDTAAYATMGQEPGPRVTVDSLGGEIRSGPGIKRRCADLSSPLGSTHRLL